MMLTWHTQDEHPEDALSACIIAVPLDSDRAHLGMLGQLHYWDGMDWRGETGDEPMCEPVFWWCAEQDLLATLSHGMVTR